MKCDYCADEIKTDEEYWHFPNLDLNYHVPCQLSESEMIQKEKRIKEAD